jgi:hypothetical protein
MTDIQELEQLQPQVSTVVVLGETIEIKPLKFRQLLQALKFMSAMIEDINPYQEKELQLFSLFGKHPEEVIGLMALVTGKPVEWFDEIGMEEGIGIVVEAIKVNRDFFSQRVQPLLEKAGLSQFVLQSEEKSLEKTENQS